MSNAAKLAIPGTGDDGKSPVYDEANDQWDLATLASGGGGSDESYQDHGNAGSSETISYTTARTHRIVLDSATCTITFTGWPASGSKGAVELFAVHDGTTSSRAIIWPGGAKFPSGTAPFTPTTTANAISRFIITTVDGGTTPFVDLVGNDYA